MNAIAIPEEKFLYDAKGKATDVVVPIDKYVEMVESYGIDLTDEERDAMREAKADIAAKNWDAFVSLEEIERELGIECTK